MRVRTTVIVLGLVLLAAVVARAGPDLAPPERLMAGEGPVDVDTGHAAPFLHDMDGDGKPDLLVGMLGGGKLFVYRNVGTREAPVFDAPTTWQADGRDATVPSG